MKKQATFYEKSLNIIKNGDSKPSSFLKYYPLSTPDDQLPQSPANEAELGYKTLRKLRGSLDTIWSNCMLKNGGNLRSLLFSGAATKQGVSLLSFHLSLFLALEYGVKVLYVDAALENGRQSEYCRYGHNSIGLASYFLDGCSLDELVFKTNIQHFYVLPSGAQTRECRTGNITSKKETLQAMAEYCHNNFEVTIYDGQPVLTAPWIIGLAKYIEEVVLVCRYASARREVARVVVDKMEENDINVGGVVLSDRSMPVPRMLYNLLK